MYESWRIHLAGGIGPGAHPRPGEELLAISGEISPPQRLKDALRRWLMGRARIVLADHLADCAREFGFTYARLSIRRPEHPLGQLFGPRDHQSELLHPVPAPRGAAVPADPRAVPYPAYEPFPGVLGVRGPLLPGLPQTGSAIARRLAACTIVAAMTQRPYDKSERVDLSDEPVHWDLGSSLSYGGYLHLDQILDAQRPLSYEHDEMMFIIVHQNSELWMRLFLHELEAVLDCVRRDNLGPILPDARAHLARADPADGDLGRA